MVFNNAPNMVIINIKYCAILGWAQYLIIMHKNSHKIAILGSGCILNDIVWSLKPNIALHVMVQSRSQLFGGGCS